MSHVFKQDPTVITNLSRLLQTPEHVFKQNLTRLDALASNVILEKFAHCHFCKSWKIKVFWAYWKWSHFWLQNIGEVKLLQNYILSESVPRLWDLGRSSFGHPRTRPLYWKKLETTTPLFSIAWNCLHSSRPMPHNMPNFRIPFCNFSLPHISIVDVACF